MKNIKIYVQLILVFISTCIFAQQSEVQYLSGTDDANTVKWDFFCTDGINSGEWTKIDVPPIVRDEFGNYPVAIPGKTKFY